MKRPFDGIRVLDATHVLAGPYAAYQLALLGADVVRIERPDEPDQGRLTGSDVAANRAGMGTQYLAQGANKRSVTLNLRHQAAREILKRLAASADVFVENFRPGAFEALGLGHAELRAINPRLVYCSISAYGQEGPRRGGTAYDSVIQAISGLMAMTGTADVHPVKLGAPVIDYATGNNAAFAIAGALFQRERSGEGQRIDVAMLDSALILASSLLTNFCRTGNGPKPIGNNHAYFATSSCYPTADGLLMLGAGNLRQQKRLWLFLGRPDMVKETNEQRVEGRHAETAYLTEVLMTRPAGEWERVLQEHQVPAARVRSLPEIMRDPHVVQRGIVRRFEAAPGLDGPFSVPVAAFKYAKGGPRVDTPPPILGEHTDAILGGLGYGAEAVAKLRAAGAV